jgi:hypothetical protein
MTLIEATYYTTSISVNTESLFSQALVAHVCNPSYLRGREQEDHSSKPARANSSRDPILKNPTRKRADKVAQGIGPEFKPQYHKKKKERENLFMDSWLQQPCPLVMYGIQKFAKGYDCVFHVLHLWETRNPGGAEHGSESNRPTF